jgi:hypothetical protein
VGTDLESDYQGAVSCEDAAPNIAEGIVSFPDPEVVRALAYLRGTKVQDLKGCLADYLFDVCYEKTKE